MPNNYITLQHGVAAGTPTNSLVLGQDLEGGIFYGRIWIDGLLYALVISPKANAFNDAVIDPIGSLEGGVMQLRNDGWKISNTFNDAAHPAFQKVRSLVIGGYDDWYIGARDEMELLYRNFKPDNVGNNANDNGYGPNGLNPSSEPAGAAYTDSNPAVTTDARFLEGGSWQTGIRINSSTETSSGTIFSQYILAGSRGYVVPNNKNVMNDAIFRPIRRVLLST